MGLVATTLTDEERCLEAALFVFGQDCKHLLTMCPIADGHKVPEKLCRRGGSVGKIKSIFLSVRSMVERFYYAIN